MDLEMVFVKNPVENAHGVDIEYHAAICAEGAEMALGVVRKDVETTSLGDIECWRYEPSGHAESSGWDASSFARKTLGLVRLELAKRVYHHILEGGRANNTEVETKVAGLGGGV
jgi:hypothetical protein